MSTNFSENGGWTPDDSFEEHLERELERRRDETINAAEQTLVDLYERRGAEWFTRQLRTWQGAADTPDTDDTALLWAAVEDFKDASWSPSQTVHAGGRLLQKAIVRKAQGAA
jgi:hypothetical protein